MFLKDCLIIFLISGFCWTVKASADTLDPMDPVTPSYAGYVQAKVAPIAAVWGEFPAFLEIRYCQQWSVELRGGLHYSLFRTIDDLGVDEPDVGYKEFRTPSLGYSAGLGFRRYPFDFGGPFQGFYYEFRADYMVFNNTIAVQGFGYPTERVFDERFTRLNGQINVGGAFRIKKHLFGELSLGMGVTHVRLNAYQYIITGPLQIFTDRNGWWMRPLITGSFKLSYCLNCGIKKK